MGDVDGFCDYLEAHAAGRAHAQRARDLGVVLGYSDRALRALAQAAADAGRLVCADSRGYFVPATWAEAAEAVGRLRSQAAAMRARADRVEALAAARFAGRPLRLWGDVA